MMSLMTLSLTMHLKYRPYHTDHLNTLETCSHLVAIVTLYTGLFYLTSAGGSHATSHSHWFFFTLLIITNLLFLLQWAYYVRLSFLRQVFFITKGTKYTWVFKLLAWQSRASFAHYHLRPEDIYLQKEVPELP